MLPHHTVPVLPRPLGPYTLLRRIAIGGMAEVYLASARGVGGFEKLLAIKVIHPRFSEDEHFIRMLIEEAKICVLLEHANVAQIFDLGCVDETYFIVMELIDGVDAYRLLSQAARQSTSVPIDVCLYITQEMCAGLDYAHRKKSNDGRAMGIVHRDVSPQNVLISFDGEVKLVDFGIAKAALRSEKTQVGTIKGKYCYMSPEQAAGVEIDHRSDIFSTAIVLYELLTGSMLYPKDSIPVLLDRVRRAEIPSASLRRSEIDAELETILGRALARDPADRYASARDFGKALTTYLARISPRFDATHVASWLASVFPEAQRRISPDHDEMHEVTTLDPKATPTDLTSTVVASRPSFTLLAGTRASSPWFAPASSPPLERVSLLSVDAPHLREARTSASLAIDPLQSDFHPPLTARIKQLLRRCLRNFYLWLAAASGLVLTLSWLIFFDSHNQPALEIISVPSGADVRLDDRAIAGKTPIRITKLRIGHEHRVSLAHAGYQPWQTVFQPTEGQVTQIAVLQPLIATLQLRTQPTGASVWINGIYYGTSPLAIQGLASGKSLELKVSAPGFVDHRQRLSIDAHLRSFTIDVVLRRR